MFEIIFYETSNEKKPIEEFLNSLDIKARVKAIDVLSILEEYGNTLREPYSKYIDDGIFELRIRFKNDTLRMFYFFFYIKSSRKPIDL